ncbi:MAG TPA: hypothetical protein VLA36_00065 [Longimicrobiales bacterium]|nr:hypothetical protein [Longimicrobiales bacterium]
MQASEVDIRFRVILLLWGSLVVGVALFTAVVWALTSGSLGSWTPTLAPGFVKNLLSAPGLLVVVGVFFRRGRVDPSGDADAFLRRYQTRILIASAMQEGGGLMGLVLCLLAGTPSWALGMGSLTVVAMLMSRPARTDLDHLAR